MKHLRKFNESTKYNVSNDIVSYLKGIKHSILQEVISDLEKELQEEEPDIDKLMAYADDIASISKKLNIDDDKVGIIYDEIYDIVSNIEKENSDKEFINDLPPEEGGPSYKEKSIKADISELKDLVSKLPKMRWNISEDDGYFGDEWDNWEHMTEEERFEYFGKMFSAVKKIKDKIESL